MKTKSAPNLILHNGRITTLDEKYPEAKNLAIKDGLIVGVDDAESYERGPETKVIDLKGRRVIPGLNDSHNREIPFKGTNWFFDHCETISDRSLERVKALGGGIAIQDRMAFQGEYFLDRYGPKAAERTPPVRKMLDMGIPVGAGTDATRVSSYNPWVSLYWLVAGKTVGGTALYSDANRLSRKEALLLYTQGSSWFSGESGKKGAIAPGQLADLIALTDDYFSVPEEQIKGIESVFTVVGGKIVHAKDEFTPLAPAPIPVLPEWSPIKVYGGYGAPLDIRKAASAGVPVLQHQHPVECRSHGCLHAAHQLLVGLKAAAPRNSDFWGLGCDCFAF